MTGSEALEVTRLIMWQTPDEVATDLEIMDHLFRLDELFDAGVFDAEEMVELKAILAKSPWARDPEFVRFCLDTRKELGHPPERFWWWPEEWAS